MGISYKGKTDSRPILFYKKDSKLILFYKGLNSAASIPVNGLVEYFLSDLDSYRIKVSELEGAIRIY